VTIFNTADGEKVVSVERISEPQDEAEDDGSSQADNPTPTDREADTDQ
jgi:DNA gyrase subunit A